MTVTICKHTCGAGTLYQWDRGQVLRIEGLSLTSAPEIHFARSGARRAVARQASMDGSGVITVTVPNELLEHAGSLHVYVCQGTGTEFCTLSDFTVPVNKREKPGNIEEV